MLSVSNAKNYTQTTLQLASSTSLAIPSTSSARSLQVRSPVHPRPGFVMQSPDLRPALQSPDHDPDKLNNKDNQSNTTSGIGSVTTPVLVQPDHLKKRVPKGIKCNAGKGKKKSSASLNVSNSSQPRSHL